MKAKNPSGRRTRQGVLAAIALLGLGICHGPAMSQEAIDPEPEAILQAMASYLGGLSTFSADYDTDNEVITHDGQKLQFSSSGTMVAQRPDRLYVHRRGTFGDGEVYVAGSAITLVSITNNAYAQFEGAGTIDDAITTIRSATGLDAPGADLLYADVYPGLMTDVRSSTYVGTGFVNGVECHHLAFRAANVDWQIWIQTGDAPLPLKFVITSAWMTGAPQYAIRIRNWQVGQAVDAARFQFAPPQGATKVDTIEVNELGEPMLVEGQ